MDAVDITKEPYAPWLESLIQQLVEMKPERIGICVISEGAALTGCYGEISPEDKAVMAYHMHMDAVMDTVKANADQLLHPEDEEDEEGDV